MSDAPYSALKAAWHADRITALRAGKQPTPVGLQLILSDTCNNDCSWCAYRSEDGLSTEQFVVMEGGVRNHNPKRMIGRDKAAEIIRDAAECGVKSITFTGGGEPTVHPQHLELFRMALDLGIECSLNTNGNILRPGWQDVLPRFTYIRVSVDAGTPEEYARVRRVSPATYEKTLQHTAALADEVRRQQSECVVGVGYVVSADVIDNVMQGVARIRDTGARYVRCASMQSLSGKSAYGSRWGEAQAAITAARDAYESESFSVIDLFEVAVGRKLTDPFCGMQHFVAYIGANLKVYRCCYVAYTKHGEAGDLSSTSLKEWLASEEKRRSYAEFDGRTCTICPLAHKNDVIGYMVKSKPLHVNFV